MVTRGRNVVRHTILQNIALHNSIGNTTHFKKTVILWTYPISLWSRFLKKLFHQINYWLVYFYYVKPFYRLAFICKCLSLAASRDHNKKSLLGQKNYIISIPWRPQLFLLISTVRKYFIDVDIIWASLQVHWKSRAFKKSLPNLKKGRTWHGGWK